MVPSLEGETCQVWWARPAHAHPSLDVLLDQAQRARRGRLLRQDDQDRLTVGAAVTRLVLARHLGRPAERLRFDRTCQVCGGQHGKPRLLDNPAGLQFSISHAGQRVAVAVVRGAPVGVDVEQLSPGLHLEVDALAGDVLSTEEHATFERLSPPDRLLGLLTYWTRKEALLKATGDGLRIPMRTITVSGPAEPPCLRRWSGRSSSLPPVALRPLRPGAGYVACVALLGMRAVQLVELDAAELLATAGRRLPVTR